MKNNLGRKSLVLLISVMLLLSIHVAAQSAQKEFHTTDIPVTVWGYVFVDGNITDPDQVTLIFPDNVSFIAELPGGGGYIINFDATGIVGETGIFEVDIYGNSWIAAETFYITGGGSYPINLTVTTFPPNEVYVDDDFNETTPGWGYDHFDNIQDGIDAVNENGTVYVYNGTYYENIIIDIDGINLIGENKNTTIIDSKGIGCAVIINSCSNVLVDDFTIRNASGDSPDRLDGNGIRIYSSSSYNIISNCTIYNNSNDGVVIYTLKHMYAEYNTIVNCEVYNNGRAGVETRADDGPFHTDNNYITKSKFYNNGITGIKISTGIYAKYNVVSDCDTYGNGASMLWASSGMYITGFGSKIVNCTSYNNYGKGILLYGVGLSGSEISNNSFFNNSKHGIYLNSSSENEIYNNEVYDNQEYGIYIHPDGLNSDNNIIYHNNFKNNLLGNAYDECNNTWDNGYPSGGNYWSDYTGDDLYSGPNQNIPGRDGIGDTPYNISGGDNQDLYPCMEPNGWINSPPNVPNRSSGEIILLPGIAYTYTTSTIDPDDDSIWFKWDWGDGTFSDWLGPYDSEEEASESHIWSQGIYEVRVKAKDSRNPETDWSEPLTVNAIFPNLKTVLLFGFITNLSISTDYNSFNVVKLLWIGFNPIFPEILSSNEVIVISDKFFGILRPSFIFGFFKAMVLT